MPTTSNTSGLTASNTSGTSTQTPWDVQTPYLQQAFQNAQNAYNSNMATGPYTGNYVAQDNGQQAAAFNGAFNYAQNPNTVQSQVTDPTNAGGSMLTSGQALADAGAQGLQNLSGDQTQNIIGQAGQYADNPYISAAVQASMYDANQQAANNTLPNLYRDAAGTNALNSDRAALQQGVVNKGLNELAGNISANMHNNAWNTGLSTAQNELNARRQGYGALGSLGQSEANLGLTGLSQGLDSQSRLNQMAAAAGAGNQGLDQNQLDNAMAKYQGNQNFPWAALNNYYNVIGNKSWGGTTNFNQNTIGYSNQNSTQNPGIASTIGGVLGAGGSMFQSGSNGSASPAQNAWNMGGTAAKSLFSFL